MKTGISPSVLVAQVKNTASWLWDDPRSREVALALSAPTEAEADRERGEVTAYLRLLLAEHFATVATFVPTDVDARIRHHVWVDVASESDLERAVAVVDQAASWDARWVSARVVESERGPLSGHDGEWLAVRAGALGQALALGAKAAAEKLATQIEDELAREGHVVSELLATRDAPLERVLSTATVVAHNLGDLSRVVDQWPGREEHAHLKRRFGRLGHPDTASDLPTRAAFVAAGALNKVMMARENHRFLALRKPRGLRTHRALLLPIGPWFERWGGVVATHDALRDKDRAEVVAALLEQHERSPDEEGCLRALAGMHAATRGGGLSVYVPDLPARLRKDALRGRVRDAIDLSPERFAARLDNKYRTWQSEFRGTR